MSISQEYGRFNIYDIFSTFLPGAIVIIGIAAPHPDAPGYFASVSLASLLVWTTVAFAVGLFLQGLASDLVSGEQGFDDRMSRVVESGRDDDAVTLADIDFLETARDEFGFDATFEDWNHMYRAVLTELEQNPPSRAIRLQALFLSMRGLVVALGILGMTTGLYALLLAFDLITSSLPYPLLIVIMTLFLLLAVFAEQRAEEFSDDVVEYMITEYRALNQESAGG